MTEILIYATLEGNSSTSWGLEHSNCTFFKNPTNKAKEYVLPELIEVHQYKTGGGWGVIVIFLKKINI